MQQQIVKRLSLILTSIELCDTNIIELQIVKLGSLELNEEVKNILKKLSIFEYGTAFLEIEAYITKYVGEVVYVDPEVKGLKLELKVLEENFQDLDTFKSEQLSILEEFNTQYILSVGEIIRKILKEKKEILAKQVAKIEDKFGDEKSYYEEIKLKTKKLEEYLTELDIFDIKYDEVYEVWKKTKEQENNQRKKLKRSKELLEEDEEFQEFQELKKHYNDFHSEYEEARNQKRFNLNDQEENELKNLFIKATRLCNPNLVSKEHKDQAYEVTLQLNKAYTQKNLKKVENILNTLEENDHFNKTNNKIENVQNMKSIIIELKEKIAIISQELKTIEEDEIFSLVQNIEDWYSYCNEVRNNLEKEYRYL